MRRVKKHFFPHLLIDEMRNKKFAHWVFSFLNEEFWNFVCISVPLAHTNKIFIVKTMNILLVFMKRKEEVSNLVVSCFFRSKNGHFWQQFWFDKWFIQEFFHSGCWDLNIGPYEWDTRTHPKVHWLLIQNHG